MGGSEKEGLNVNLMLVGRSGDGKSASGNTILGRKAFNSRPSSSTVTKVSELHNGVWEAGQMVNVIDTPGTLCKQIGYASFDNYMVDFFILCYQLSIIILTNKVKF